MLAVGVTCIVLGAWQLDRLEERRTANAVQAARFEQDPIPLPDLVAAAGGDLESLEYRRATFTGTFDPSQEVLVRSQVRDGRAGFDVVTPMVGSGETALVNRGWVPLEFDEAPVAAATPPAETVDVTGVVRPSEPATATSPDEGSATVSRVDIPLLEERLGVDLLPVYLEVIGDASATQLPIPARAPDFSDEGPHLNYAIQWFSFAVVAAVGYGFLLRRAVRARSAGGKGESGDDLDAGETS